MLDVAPHSSHTVRVLNEDGTEVCRRRCEPTVDSLTAVTNAAFAGAPVNTTLQFVNEPTGPAWLPVAVFFSSRGQGSHQGSRAAAAAGHTG